MKDLPAAPAWLEALEGAGTALEAAEAVRQGLGALWSDIRRLGNFNPALDGLYADVSSLRGALLAKLQALSAAEARASDLLSLPGLAAMPLRWLVGDEAFGSVHDALEAAAELDAQGEEVRILRLHMGRVDDVTEAMREAEFLRLSYADLLHEAPEWVRLAPGFAEALEEAAGGGWIDLAGRRADELLAMERDGPLY